MTVSDNDMQRITELVRAAVAKWDCRTLALDDARAIAELAERKAAELDVAVVISVADAAGAAILMHRMDNALPASTELAADKAYSAAVFRMSTDELGIQAQPGGPLYGVQSSHRGRIVVFGGGLPVGRCGAVIGAIGISGGTVAQDMQIASHALQAFQAEAKICSAKGCAAKNCNKGEK